MKELAKLPRELAYFGKMQGTNPVLHTSTSRNAERYLPRDLTRFPPYASGAGYVLSRDLAEVCWSQLSRAPSLVLHLVLLRWCSTLSSFAGAPPCPPSLVLHLVLLCQCSPLFPPLLVLTTFPPLSVLATFFSFAGHRTVLRRLSACQQECHCVVDACSQVCHCVVGTCSQECHCVIDACSQECHCVVGTCSQECHCVVDNCSQECHCVVDTCSQECHWISPPLPV
jgi:hypothetical protein